VLLTLLASSGAYGQSRSADSGNCALGGKVVVACWNFAAGSAMPNDYGQYPERLPFLRGWDFRINLPHVRFQRGTDDAGSAPALVGVVEDATPPTSKQGTLFLYGHKNNSLWIFRVASDKRAYFKLLPSRRDPASAAVENISSLTSGWVRIGSTDAPMLRLEQPAVAVVGEGIGNAVIVLVARGEDGILYFTTRRLTNTSATWTAPWQALGRSESRPTLTAAFTGTAALAWREPDSDLVRVRLYDIATATWGPSSVPPGAFAEGEPLLVSSPDRLNLFFTSKLGSRLLYTSAATTGLEFSKPDVVSAAPVRAGMTSALWFNQRLHVVYTEAGGSAARVWYTVSVPANGSPASWTPRSDTGLRTIGPVQIASVYDQVFVLALAADRKLEYARKDPNFRGPDAGGGSPIWLDVGRTVDAGTPGDFLAGFDAISFNNDIYLAGQNSAPARRGLYILNFSRAAMKQLITEKWGIKLAWGGSGGGALSIVDSSGSKIAFANDSVVALGDADGDGTDDLIRFTQRARAGVGPAPVDVASEPDWKSRIWHTFFSLKGEVPLVGDFNGDGKDDIVTFVQKEQKFADGSPIGPAPVWVALSDGSRFQASRIWHTFFSLKGEVPLVGDFNLDGKDDIVTFVHDRVAGDVARNVYVAASTGSSFSRSTMWYSDFGSKDQTPAVGSLGALSAITGASADRKRPIPDLFAFDRKSGSVSLAQTMRAVPYPSGAPWERYKWFTEKGLGVAQFPEWIYRRPAHCLRPGYRFNLLGASGSGGATAANLSVRLGGRAGFVIQEFGHTLFANCFRKSTDPMYAGIYTSAGVGSNDYWGGGSMSSADCAGGQSAESITVLPPNGGGTPSRFYDCRDDVAEHYFLALLVHYRLNGEEFRGLIGTAANAARRARLARQYAWLRDTWFNGTQFRRGRATGASYAPDGIQCLLGDC
jgi:hypothetical protein